MEFPQTLDYLKHAPHTDAKITRSCWNGPYMFVCLTINKDTADATGLPEGSWVLFLPYLVFKTAQGDFVP